MQWRCYCQIIRLRYHIRLFCLAVVRFKPLSPVSLYQRSSLFRNICIAPPQVSDSVRTVCFPLPMPYNLKSNNNQIPDCSCCIEMDILSSSLFLLSSLSLCRPVPYMFLRFCIQSLTGSLPYRWPTHTKIAHTENEIPQRFTKSVWTFFIYCSAFVHRLLPRLISGAKWFARKNHPPRFEKAEGEW